MTITGLFNPFRFISQFPSIYEAKQALTVLQKQRFVEWFSGDDIDLIWTKTNIANAGTFAMIDAIDEGFSIRCNTAIDSASQITFNNIRHYLETACIAIWIGKNNRLVSGDIRFGFTGETNVLNPINSAFAISQSSGGSFFDLVTKDATTGSAQASSVALDALFHNHKTECRSADIQYTLDGVLEVTKTTNRPTAKMQPYFQAINGGGGGVNEGRVRYCEALNT